MARPEAHHGCVDDSRRIVLRGVQNLAGLDEWTPRDGELPAEQPGIARNDGGLGCSYRIGETRQEFRYLGLVLVDPAVVTSHDVATLKAEQGRQDASFVVPVARELGSSSKRLLEMRIEK